MITRWTLLLLLTAAVPGCVTYEYEHEFWLNVDGSGSVYVTGRPDLWATFKGLDDPRAPAEKLREDARRLFERSGLRVRRVTVTRRGGREYLFVAADFKDVNQLTATPAFRDLLINLRPEGRRLLLTGTWSRLPTALPPAAKASTDDLMAVRFHLPSKVYSHSNAFAGVERGNIVGWRQPLEQALAGRPLEFGAAMDQRSILLSTVRLFATAIGLASLLLVGALYLFFRRGRRHLAESQPPSAG